MLAALAVAGVDSMATQRSLRARRGHVDPGVGHGGHGVHGGHGDHGDCVTKSKQDGVIRRGWTGTSGLTLLLPIEHSPKN